MKLSIVVPMFNEAENVPRIRAELLPVVHELAQLHDVEVILVDDGSTDGTGVRLASAFKHLGGAQLRFVFLRHQTNCGLGAALQTGFAASIGDAIVTVDSDGGNAFREIPSLLSYLTPGVDIVTASPYHPGGRVEGIPAYRLLLSRACSLGYRLLVDRRVHTYTCLFRAFRRSVIESLAIERAGHLAVTELLVKAMLQGYRVAEYPAVLRRRSLGSSKVNLIRTIWDHLRFQAFLALARMTVRPLASQPERHKLLS